MAGMVARAKEIRERLYPVLRTSAFVERGVLTPEEFVAAGEELVYKCPTWTWSAGEKDKRKAYLPDEKQFLVTNNVPCSERCAALEGSSKVLLLGPHVI
jgi:ubiquitin-like-conjugating enzyme ATG3